MSIHWSIVRQLDWSLFESAADDEEVARGNAMLGLVSCDLLLDVLRWVLFA